MRVYISAKEKAELTGGFCEISFFPATEWLCMIKF